MVEIARFDLFDAKSDEIGFMTALGLLSGVCRYTKVLIGEPIVTRIFRIGAKSVLMLAKRGPTLGMTGI